ncbi:hypothetical protein OEZ85_007340 [Tetradesmus obliquus]|uniref:FAST kinase leucine-rich domain-containing protein n=1 Tax=Tetradesmus obliquus TaxID=3088 RepID=A0ABY8TXB0_TETOB|nr:hypothetical protein OEZ85_007340 [Tetradesmus obliquus]
MLQQMRVARPWDLATAAWACSKLSFSEPRLLEAIAQEAARKAPILTPQDIAQLASAYARLAYRQPALLTLLGQQALRQADGFKPWSLIHTAWALHVSGANAKPLLQACGELLPQKLAGLQPLDVATLLWLLAASDMREHWQLVVAAAEQVAAGIEGYPPAAAAQALVSLAGLGYRDSALAEAAAAVMIKQLRSQLQQQQQEEEEEEPPEQQTQQQQRYGPKQVAHATFAIVRLGSTSQALLDAASDAFLAQPRRYSPALLCMLCWAFVQAGAAPSAAFSEAFVAQCMAQLPRFSADQMASLLRGVHPPSRWPGSPQLLAAAASQLPQQLQHMSSPVLAKLISALSKQLHAARKAQQQQEEQQQLQALLQQCGQQWLQRRGSQGDRMQGEAVAAALAAAGLQELADAVRQVQVPDQEQSEEAAAADSSNAAGGEAEASSSLQQQQAAAAAGGSSWLDSFVATADEAGDEAGRQ